MSDFKSYLVQNGVIPVTAGITIGFATVTFIKSLVADLVLPLVFLVIVKGTGAVSKDASGFFGRFLTKKDFLFTNFVSELITWLLIVVVALVILNAVYVHYIQNKPFISQETLMKPFHVAQELVNPFVPEFFNAPTSKEHEQQQVLWGATD